MSNYNPFGYSYPGVINPFPLIAGASNVRDGENPSFTAEDFFGLYPQFQNSISEEILTQFIAMANAVVKEVRWHEMWKMGMGWFVAHFASLYLQTLTSENATAKQVVAAAQARGLQTSKSVGDVSVGYDFGTISGDLDGWAQWKLTQYGIQFASTARLLGKGGSYVW